MFPPIGAGPGPGPVPEGEDPAAPAAPTGRTGAGPSADRWRPTAPGTARGTPRPTRPAGGSRTRPTHPPSGIGSPGSPSGCAWIPGRSAAVCSRPRGSGNPRRTIPATRRPICWPAGRSSRGEVRRPPGPRLAAEMPPTPRPAGTPNWWRPSRTSVCTRPAWPSLR